MNPPREKTTRIHRSALVPYSAQRMFDLVADVKAYPEFLPWCRRASIASADGQQMQATLEIAKGPLRKSFTTRNVLHPPGRIEIALQEGPFRELQGCWTFEDLSGDGSRVTLDLEFQVAGALLGRTLAPVFGEIANTLVEAFSRRARSLYGA
jgi:ribosome-associated toxin RatA of RatAB toxin-antitoxin module